MTNTHIGRGAKNNGLVVPCTAPPGMCPNGPAESHLKFDDTASMRAYNQLAEAGRDTGLYLLSGMTTRTYRHGDPTPHVGIATGPAGVEERLELAYRVDDMTAEEREAALRAPGQNPEARLLRQSQSAGIPIVPVDRIVTDTDPAGRRLFAEDREAMHRFRDAGTLMLDLDGCVGDFDSMIRDHYIRKGADFSKAAPEPDHYSFEKSTNGWAEATSGYKFISQYCTSVGQGGYIREPYDESAVRALNLIQENGTRIIVVTNRGFPWSRGKWSEWQDDRAKDDTAMWLQRIGLRVDGLVYAKHKTDVKADMYIDDAPRNIGEIHDAGRHAILIPHLYNRDADAPAVMDWNELLEAKGIDPTPSRPAAGGNDGRVTPTGPARTDATRALRKNK